MKILRRMILLLSLLPLTIYAQERVTSYERMRNFGIVYGAQWLTYVATQKPIIEKHGSFRNWIKNPSSPHFDNDSFDYNLFQHSLTGSAYYLFYRSQDYRKVDSLLWAVISSTAFEFTVETVTERPSWQDLYQTPVYGSLLGMGLEAVSDKFFSSGTWWGKALGYVVNPFRLLKKDDDQKEAFLPFYDGRKAGVVYLREFE